jgi:hypothetical protein
MAPGLGVGQRALTDQLGTGMCRPLFPRFIQGSKGQFSSLPAFGIHQAMLGLRLDRAQYLITLKSAGLHSQCPCLAGSSYLVVALTPTASWARLAPADPQWDGGKVASP